MKTLTQKIRTVLLGVAILALTGFVTKTGYADDVCSTGISEPPFLSFGVKSNLLLAIDNSGSMLDTAYEDPDNSQCFDDSYNSAKVYAGNYSSKDANGDSIWYQWVKGPYSPWKTATEYGDTDEPKRVYVNGIIYQVQAACTSSGNTLDEDTACDWQKLVEVDVWQQGFSYAAGSFIVDRKQLYLTKDACTSSQGSEIAADTGCSWQPVDHTWRADITYAVGAVVTYNGKYFEAAGLTAPAKGAAPETTSAWTYLAEGNYVQVTGGIANIATFCNSSGAGTTKYMSDMCMRVDTTTTPNTLVTFAAKGSFLNWATASKFDIQKEILTGGKYDEKRGLIVSESRGCSGSGYIKQIALTSGGYLTLRVRGSFTEDGAPSTWDWVDSTDNTTRLEILGFSAGGFNMQACQDAIDKILTVGSGFQSDVDACLSGSTNDERNALNHALQYCWQDTHTRNLNVIGGDCEEMYGSLHPSSINAYNDAYNCYGIYDTKYDHDNRVGYVGRCWDTGTVTGASSCDEQDSTCGSAGGTCGEYSVGGKLFRNKIGSNYTEICTQTNKDGDQCQNEQKWIVYYIDSASKNQCDPNDSVYSATNPHWSGILYPTKNPNNDPADDPEYNADVIPNNPTLGKDGSGVEKNVGVDQWWCVYQAMEDYCGDLKVPEVIDPSDQATTTTTYWNIPGNLVDSGVFSQLGIEQPLVVMKGYIAASAAPEGILQEVKDDLRIGVMAFNDNGAKTECDAANTSDVIEQYCPPHTQDGGQVITNILLGSLDVGGGREHIDDVVAAVNATRATSWTPLAEALYTAIGYYTQQTGLRLNADDFQVGAGLDPITNWCQENNILIITEGASTADINQQMINYVNAAAAKDTDLTADKTCPGALNSSTYLDDLTYIAKHSTATDLYGAGNETMSTGEDSDGDGVIDRKEKQKINTHIVVAGSLRVEGTDECSPDKLITNAAKNGGSELILGEDPEKLESGLLEKFNELRQRSSAGSAASVISSSRGGEGAIYQAIFWPELKREHANTQEYSVDWVGDVHALFINDAGYMFEDTNSNRQFDIPEDVDFDGKLDVLEDANGNGKLDPGEDIDLDGNLDVKEDLNNNNQLDGDKRVVIYFDNSAAKSKGCYNATVLTTGVCSNSKDLDEIKFIWSAADWLNSTSLLTSANRTYLSADRKRYIFTWLDLNNNGIVDDDLDGTLEDADEIRPFVTGLALNSSATGNLPVSGTRSPVYADFGVATTGEVDSIVSWIRGDDSLIDEDVVVKNNILDPGEDTNGNGRLDTIKRSRQIPVTENGGTLMTWRLGDIIHSTPMTVSEPAEGFHLIYRDRSYANFVGKYKERRHMVYFGGNDGMLHAINGGFYKEDELKFCLTSAVDANGHCDESAGNFPLLGAEMWAYVPYNIIPHLNCLTDEAYAHKYFVDLRPRIFDVKIFTEETECTTIGINDPKCVHPNGWGTILVGGMRLGGSPANAYSVSADENDDVADDNRRFISSYFIMDITNPEKAPTLLGELTQQLDNSNAQKYVDLGYSTTIPTMVIMKNPASKTNGVETNEWYLVFGSGPHGDDAMKGMSDQNAKVSVLPLRWLGTASSLDKRALRLPATVPVSTDPGGTFELTNSPNGFVSDMITVDFDIDPSTFDYMADAVYFGTTERDPVTNADSTISLVGGGTLYRLVTRNTVGPPPVSPYGSGVIQIPKAPHEWLMTTMLDLSRTAKPFSSAANVGYDGRNFWVYIGTGRFWDADDKTDTSQQTFYGLKEPMTFNATTGNPDKFLWSQIEKDDNINAVTGADNGLSANGAGDRGLLRVDDILVAQSDSATTAKLSCRNNSDTLNGAVATGDMSCIPEVIREIGPPSTAYFSSLEGYIAGRRFGTCTANKVDCTDGWYKDFWPYANRERNLGQSTLLGGLVTFTTYQPFSEPCQAEGIANLYAVYYRTGTSWYENIFGTYGVIYGNVTNKLNLGRGLATTPNLHTGSGGDEGPRAFIQTSTGEIKEIQQENLPIKGYESGRSKWKEYIP